MLHSTGTVVAIPYREPTDFAKNAMLLDLRALHLTIHAGISTHRTKVPEHDEYLVVSSDC